MTTMPAPTAALRRLASLRPEMLAALQTLVDAESPSDDVAATGRCAGVVAEIGTALLGVAPETCVVDGRPHLRWSFGTPRVVLLGHLDTVWPVGTVARRPFHVDGDVVTGPGVYDMKAGVVQALFGLSLLADLDGVAVLFNTDEEIGSPTSRALIEELTAGAAAVLVLEPATDRAVKIGRKGIARYRLEVTGRAAHAGVEPDRGVNALVELSHQVLALSALAAPALGTTVTPTVARAGTTANTVPASAWLDVDVRAASSAEQLRVDAALRATTPTLPGARLAVAGGSHRPVFHEDAAATLYPRAVKVAERLGLGALPSISVGGASDGNFTAAMGIPTLDGLGALGAGAHADDEHVLVSGMAQRGALLHGLVGDLLAD